MPVPAGGNGDSITPAVSLDGRFVLFSSSANNLVSGDNSQPGLDVFLRDRTSNTTVLVSANFSATGGGNGDSLAGQISTNGRYAVFQSDSIDLLANDTNGVSDIFLRDLETGTNILVSVAADGRWGNGASTDPVMTPDGRHVAFVSAATNLVSDDTNGIPDLFLRDLVSQTTTRVTAGATGLNTSISSPTITPDGRYVAFSSTATGMAPGVPASNTGEIYLYDSVLKKITWASTNAALIVSNLLQLTSMPSTHPVLSDDGSFVAFKTGWTNGITSPGGSAVSAVVFFLYDSLNQTTTILSTNGYAPWANCDDVYGPEMTPDGRFIAFVQREPDGGTNGSSVWLWDRQAGTNALISADTSGSWPSNTTSHTPALSQDGRHVTFLSDATNLVGNTVSNGLHVYLRDLQTATTTLIDADTNGVGSGDQLGAIPALSADGQCVVYSAPDGGLFAMDDNNAQDVVLWNATTGTNILISQRAPQISSQTGNRVSSLGQPAINGIGGLVAFASFASDLATNDFNGDADVFVHDLTTDANLLVSVGLDGNAGRGGGSFNPIISADGRHVTFVSGATNLVAGDTNGAMDVFRRDLQTDTTELVSVYSNHASLGKYDSFSPVSSQDGRYIAFLCRTNSSSTLTNLFWRDMDLNLTRLVSGTVHPDRMISMSANGQRVAYFSSQSWLYVWDANLARNIYTNTTSLLASAAISPAGNRLLYQVSNQLFIYDLAGKTNLLLCPSSVQINGSSQWNGDGRYVAFVTATNLVAGDNNGTNDVYLMDFQTGAFTLVSTDESGTASAAGASDSPVVSTDGRFVVFRSFATNAASGVATPPSLVMFDRLAGTNSQLVSGTIGAGWPTWVARPVFSTDESRLAFQSWNAGLISGDLNRAGDLFAHDLGGWPALDSDDDGIPDWWMIENFGHPTGQAEDLSRAQDDADEDGMNSLQEFLAGTIPTNPASLLALGIAPDNTGTNMLLNWMAAPGKNYQILSTTNLMEAVWPVLPESIQAGSAGEIGGHRYLSVPATSRQQYFRIQTGN